MKAKVDQSSSLVVSSQAEEFKCRLNAIEFKMEISISLASVRLSVCVSVCLSILVTATYFISPLYRLFSRHKETLQI